KFRLQNLATVLTRVTRIFEKRVFNETTPVARARVRTGLLLRGRGGYFPYRCKPPVAETNGLCFRPVLYRENTYRSVWRRKRLPTAVSLETEPRAPLRLAACSPDPSPRWSRR